MKIGIVRQGKYGKCDRKPSKQTGYLVFDVLSDALEEIGCQTRNIGVVRNSGADVEFMPQSFDKTIFDHKRFRNKTQQAVTESILSLDSEKTVGGLDALIMEFYTLMDNRCIWFPFVYACAEMGVTCLLWDTDANFVSGELPYTIKKTRSQAVREFARPSHVNGDLLDTDILNDLDFHVLSPAFFPPHPFVDYFPFFHIFHQRKFNFDRKFTDVVYAGSRYQRDDRFMRYYDTNAYSVEVYGKYDQKFLATMKYPGNIVGHVVREGVQDVLSEGLCCVNIARPVYERLGQLVPRVFEVVSSGTLLLVDGNIKGAEKAVGEEFVVHNAAEVSRFVRSSRKRCEGWFEQQMNHPYMKEATPINRAKLLLDIIRRKHTDD